MSKPLSEFDRQAQLARAIPEQDYTNGGMPLSKEAEEEKAELEKIALTHRQQRQKEHEARKLAATMAAEAAQADMKRSEDESKERLAKFKPDTSNAGMGELKNLVDPQQPQNIVPVPATQTPNPNDVTKYTEQEKAKDKKKAEVQAEVFKAKNALTPMKQEGFGEKAWGTGTDVLKKLGGNLDMLLTGGLVSSLGIPAAKGIKGLFSKKDRSDIDPAESGTVEQKTQGPHGDEIDQPVDEAHADIAEQQSKDSTTALVEMQKDTRGIYNILKDGIDKGKKDKEDENDPGFVKNLITRFMPTVLAVLGIGAGVLATFASVLGPLVSGIAKAKANNAEMDKEGVINTMDAKNVILAGKGAMGDDEYKTEQTKQLQNITYFKTKEAEIQKQIDEIEEQSKSKSATKDDVKKYKAEIEVLKEKQKDFIQLAEGAKEGKGELSTFDFSKDGAFESKFGGKEDSAEFMKLSDDDKKKARTLLASERKESTEAEDLRRSDVKRTLKASAEMDEEGEVPNQIINAIADKVKVQLSDEERDALKQSISTGKETELSQKVIEKLSGNRDSGISYKEHAKNFEIQMGSMQNKELLNGMLAQQKKEGDVNPNVNITQVAASGDPSSAALVARFDDLLKVMRSINANTKNNKEQR